MGISVIGEVRWMAFSSNGSRVAIHDEKRVTVYETPTGRIVFRLPYTTLIVTECAYSPDGQFLACKGVRDADYPNHIELIQIWDICRNKEICCIESPPNKKFGTSGCLKFSPNSAQLAIVRIDGFVSIIRVATGQSIQIESQSNHVCSLSSSCVFFPGSESLVYTHPGEAIKVADLDAARTSLSLKLNTQPSASEHIELVGFRPSDQNLLVALYGKDDYDNRIEVLDPRNGVRTPFISGSRGYKWCPLHTTLSPSGKHLAASVFKEVRSLLLAQPLHAVMVWDAYTGQIIKDRTTDTLTSRGLFSSVFSLAFGPAENLFVGRRDSIDQVAVH